MDGKLVVLTNDLLLTEAVFNLAINKTNEAINQTTEIINKTKPYISESDLLSAYELQSKAYYKQNNYKKAFEVNEQFSKLKDDLPVAGAYKQFDLLRRKSEKSATDKIALKQKAENDLLFQEQRNSTIIRYSIIGAFTLLAALMLLLYRQVRIKQKNNAKLEQRNALINEQNLELRKMNAVLDEARVQAESASVAKSNF
ncbi:MAG: hypothetical protein RLZZ337_368 [Bacteroidota bacterium]|jgi:hypothetical protein